MKLTGEDQAMLDGVQGEGVAVAMQVLVAIGRAFDAEQMCDITRAHVALSNQDADIWFAGAPGGGRRRVQGPAHGEPRILPGVLPEGSGAHARGHEHHGAHRCRLQGTRGAVDV